MSTTTSNNNKSSSSEQQQKRFINKIRPSKELLKIPEIAWPTVLLFLFALFGNLSMVYLGALKNYSLFLTLPFQVFFVYVLFTPMHDSAHNSVSSKYRWINTTIGRICAIPFMAPFPAFKHIHLSHHKYTNDAEKDPDYYSEKGKSLIEQILHWGSQDYYYLYWYFTRRHLRPKEEVQETLRTAGVIYAIMLISMFTGHFPIIFKYWLLPCRFAIIYLALVFDYIPHHRFPHTVLGWVDPYKATHKMKKLFGLEMTIATLSQNMHCIHHLYSQVPWYRYHYVWKEVGQQLKEAGVDTYGFYPENDEKGRW